MPYLPGGATAQDVVLQSDDDLGSRQAAGLMGFNAHFTNFTVLLQDRTVIGWSNHSDRCPLSGKSTWTGVICTNSTVSGLNFTNIPLGGNGFLLAVTLPLSWLRLAFHRSVKVGRNPTRPMNHEANLLDLTSTFVLAQYMSYACILQPSWFEHREAMLEGDMMWIANQPYPCICRLISMTTSVLCMLY